MEEMIERICWGQIMGEIMNGNGLENIKKKWKIEQKWMGPVEGFPRAEIMTE